MYNLGGSNDARKNVKNMADKLENALNSASDAAYVRAIDSNGNSIQISKADLAAVLKPNIVKFNQNNFYSETFNSGESYQLTAKVSAALLFVTNIYRGLIYTTIAICGYNSIYELYKSDENISLDVSISYGQIAITNNTTDTAAAKGFMIYLPFED